MAILIQLCFFLFVGTTIYILHKIDLRNFSAMDSYKVIPPIYSYFYLKKYNSIASCIVSAINIAALILFVIYVLGYI